MGWMRVLLIFGSMAPLAALTAWSVRDAVVSVPVAVAGASVAAPEKVPTPPELATLKVDVDQDERAAKWLNEQLVRPYEKWTPPPVANARWKPVADAAVPKLENTRQLLIDWTEVVRDTETFERASIDVLEQEGANLETATERLEGLRQKVESKANDVTRAAALSELVDRRLVRIQDLGKRMATGRTNRDVFKRAEQAFKAAQYDQAVRILSAEWLGARTAEVDTLEVAARYHKDAEALRLRLSQATRVADVKAFREPMAAWPELARDLEVFFTKYPEPPVGASATLDTDLRKGLSKVRVLIAMQDLPRVPLKNVAQWLSAARRIGQLSPDDEARSLMAEIAKDWLLRGLAAKTIPEKDYKYSVDSQRGSLLEGEFITAPGGGSWRFWPRNKPSASNPNAYESYPLNRLEPREPPDKLATRDYQAQRQKLEADWSTQRAWQEFARRCERYEQEIEKYTKIGGQADVTFAAEGQFAADVVKNWEELEPILNR
ncbi:MAG: hypothetical protein RLY70_2059 [Planctomycetota bacterium]|jgi:hypothetical protein